jgi:hypothetical protein
MTSQNQGQTTFSGFPAPRCEGGNDPRPDRGERRVWSEKKRGLSLFLEALILELS